MMNVVSRTLEVWNQMRGNDSVPYRSQLDPGKIGDIANRLAIIETVKMGVFNFRVTGHHLDQLSRFHLRGMNFLTIFDREDRNAALAAVNKVMLNSAPVLISGDIHTPKQSAFYQIILLPMRSDNGTIDRILLAADWDKNFESAAQFKISNTEILGDMPKPAVELKTIEGGGNPGTPRGRGHLRLVHSSDG